MVIYKNIYLLNTTQVLKILLFPKNNSKKTKKPFSKRPKGLKCLGSPYWTGSELMELK